jgi:hypothetical protein
LAAKKHGTIFADGLSKYFGGNPMIAKKRVKTPASNSHRAPFWLKAVERSSVPIAEKSMGVFEPDILIDPQYQSTYRRRF